ncbi:hypothetical protein QQ008_13600 [Fulvivirgaceae bacterium BMA10]|uniref:Uncharacterized protein n=1 Tax=Splendidivirga corallicola TaxID=3051826 RepID=A0ABT8KNW8_9BACT|nr:hypothetical protein [Fulvivirgaceae bacterium BMA10]
MSDLKKTIKANQHWIMEVDGVIGIGAGLTKTEPREKCILIYTTRADWPQEIPHEIDNYKVEMIIKKRGFKSF